MTSKTEVHYNESGNGKLYYAEDVEVSGYSQMIKLKDTLDESLRQSEDENYIFIRPSHLV